MSDLSLMGLLHQALFYHGRVAKQRIFSWSLGVAGSVAALLLLGWLVSMVLSNTTLGADLTNHKVTAETTLGNIKCRKELKATFPFFELNCEDVQEHP